MSKKRIIIITLVGLVILILFIILGVLIAKSKNMQNNVDVPVSAPVSTAVGIPPAIITDNRDGYPTFPPITNADLTWGNDEYFTTIQNFYTALKRKDYATAFKIGAQGRTQEQIAEIYSSTDDVDYYSIVKNSLTNYDVNVTLRSGTDMFFYKVNLNLIKDDMNNVYIMNSSIKNEYTRMFPDCGRDSIDLAFDIGKLCVLRDWDSGNFFKVATYSITPYPFFIKGRNIDANKDYYVAHSGEFGDFMQIFIYDKGSNKFIFVNELSHENPYFADGTRLPDDCKLDSEDSYRQSCVIGYSDKDWYKHGVYYFQNKDKYE